LATQWAAITIVPFFANIEINTDPTATAITPKARAAKFLERFDTARAAAAARSEDNNS
jgi:hypothetical protein